MRRDDRLTAPRRARPARTGETDDTMVDGESSPARATPRSALPPAGEATVPDSPGEATPWFAELWARLKEHHLARWALGYAAFAVALLHAVTLVSDALAWPHAVLRVLTLALIAGLVAVPAYAWYHEVRAQRPGPWELALIALLLVTGGWALWHYAGGHADASESGSAQEFHPPPHSIAVLPFVNMSADSHQEYFSDGISEELLNALTDLDGLQVIARSSSFAFKGQNLDAKAIARKLNVASILEGSVRRAGNDVRITVQLVNAGDGFQLWSQTYDRELNDILQVQEEVASAVAGELKVKLTPAAQARIELGGTHNPDAYDAFLRGQAIYQNAQSTEESLRAALSFYDRALAFDPNYALAHGHRAHALVGISLFYLQGDELAATRAQARAAAQRAVALAPDSGEAHVELAYALALGVQDYAAAAPEFERALVLSPGSAQVQRLYGFFQAVLGHPDRAIAAGRRAVELDPRNALVRIALAQDFYFSRRYSEALTVLREALPFSPGSPYIAQWTMQTLLALRQIGEAQRFCTDTTGHLWESDRHRCLALVQHALAHPSEADEELAQYQALEKDRAAYLYAGIYAQWGDPTRALQWLKRAAELRDPHLYSLKVDWELDPIRSTSDYRGIETRENFPP
jgi:TolB-like protein/tetratricopeptide (TPR) repeat protein